MKICANCGTHLDDTAVVCTTCGTPATVTEAPATAPVATQPGVSPTDAPSKGFWCLGFFFGFVGLILYFVFRHKSPQRAKSALKGFITGMIVSAAIYIVYIIIYVVILGAAIGSSMYY